MTRSEPSRTIVFSHANGFPAGTYRSLFEVWRIIGGTQSNEVRQVGMRATQRLTHGQVSWIDGSHLFPFEKPAETAAEVLRWLALFSAPSTLGTRATPHL